MLTRKKNIPFFSQPNSDFHAATQVVRDEVFQTETTGLIGYVQSSSANFEAKKLRIRYAGQDGVIDPETAPNDSDGVHAYTDEIGPAENRLVSTLLSTSYTTIVLTGALGSGKSAISTFALDYIENKVFRSADCSIIRISFTEGYFQIDDYRKVAHLFLRQMSERMEAALTKHYSHSNLIDSFVSQIEPKLSPDWEASFLPFKRKVVEKNALAEVNWTDLTSSQKCAHLMEWIRNEHADHETRLNLLGYLARFMKSNHPNNRCVLLFLDNIDRLVDEAQAEILMMVFAFAQLTKIKTLIPLRLTTFGWVTQNASFSFCHFPHLGNPATSIVRLRIEDYLSKWDSPQYSSLEEKIRNRDYARFFKARLTRVSDFLKNPSTRLSTALSALSGESIRRGLFLAERFVSNSTVAYADKDVHEDDLERALLVDGNSDGSLSNDDSLIVNLFVAPREGGPTMLNVRVLQILKNALALLRPYVTVKDLLSHLRHLQSWDHKDILLAMNMLMNPRKRLIYADGVSVYRDTKELFTSVDDKLYLTTTGERYLDSLVYDVVYVQEAFAVLDWSSSSIPSEVDYQSIVQRISFVRRCLRYLLDRDIRQVTKYRNSGLYRNKLLIHELITFQIISRLASHVSRILSQSQSSPSVQAELLDWLSIVQLAMDFEHRLFHKPRSHYALAEEWVSQLRRLGSPSQNAT